MASGVDRSEFSGPPKRRKLEDDEFGPSTKVKILESDVGPSISASSEDLEGSLGDNNGFSVSNERSKPVSGANSSNTSPTGSSSDDTGFPLDTADEKDEVSSTVSNLSDISGISMLSDDDDGSEEYNQASNWVRQQIHLRTDPRAVLKHLCSEHTQIPEEVDDLTLWRIVINMMSEPPKRQKLPDVNTVENVVELINKSKNIIVLTGAGVSVSCGIPDFRSRDGIYSRLAQDFPDLPDPQAMFDINYFSQDPRPFYKFAREIYPGQFKPSPCHEFIKMLEDQGKLLRNYSQNIDTLERVCGIKNVIECHGSFATASCTKCKHQVPSDDIKQDIFSQTIPMCCKCQEQSLPPMTESSSNPNDNFKDLVAQGVMKPDIVFFGEGLPDAFHEAMANDKDVCDLLIVMGSSLKVRPVALIPSSIPSHVPQILINRESLPHLEFDVELLGDGDVVINQICHMLAGNFKKVCWRDTILEEIQRLPVHPQSPMNNDWEHSQDGIEDQEAYKFLNLLETNSKTKKKDLDEDINEDNTTVQDGELRKKISDPENQNSILSQKFLPGSSKVDHFSEISKKREHDVPDSYNGHDKSVTREGSFKKLKSDSDEQNYSESEPNLSTKFYANINHYLEKQTNSMDVDVSNNTNSKYDESLSKYHTSRKQKESCTKKDSENIGNNTLDDRPERTDVSLRKNEENNECSSLLQTDCMDVRNLSFHSQVTEHTVKNFQFIEKSRDRQFNSLNFVNNLNSDIENIPKTLDSYRGKSMTLSSSGSPTTSNESSSRTTEEIYISEDCHVVPRIDCLRDDPILDENLILSKSTDKMDLKPRHASIDSVMDSALGDSCSSSDCQKRKNDEDNTEDNTDDEGRWKSLLENFPSTESNSYVSLPDNSFYKLKPGKYVFPGAEICSNFTRNESGGLRSGSTTVQLCEH